VPLAVLVAALALVAACADSSEPSSATTSIAGATATSIAGGADQGLGGLVGAFSDDERACVATASGAPSATAADLAAAPSLFAAMVTCRPAAFVADLTETTQAAIGVGATEATCATRAMLDGLAGRPTLVAALTSGGAGAELRAVLGGPLRACGLTAAQVDQLTGA
jgi:hypothetical protein